MPSYIPRFAATLAKSRGSYVAQARTQPRTRYTLVDRLLCDKSCWINLHFATTDINVQQRYPGAFGIQHGIEQSMRVLVVISVDILMGPHW